MSSTTPDASQSASRAAFEAALAFATAERRGGPTPIIEHQNVGTILVDMKARLEAARYLTWKACGIAMGSVPPGQPAGAASAAHRGCCSPSGGRGSACG
jgi:alkylation response protein AidB-like acyl-CoA dehydrogenase